MNHANKKVPYLLNTKGVQLQGCTETGHLKPVERRYETLRNASRVRFS